MKCKECGAEIEEGMKFCGECGAPIPQVKKCIKCGAEIALKMKFCPECGARQDGGAAPSSSGGFSMGDKNVVAGDVIGSKEETHISGNATIIKNEDETKKTAKCHVCGKIILRMDGYECSHCGEFTCSDCYDKITKMCRFCSSSSTSDNEEKYREKLRTILADGKITQEERNELKLLQNQLGISNERAQRIEDAFRNGGNENGLTTAEKLDLENAENLLYGEGTAAEALAIVEPIYERNSSSEEVLNIYIPILAEADTEKAKKVIDSLQFDCAMAYATSVQLSLAEGSLDSAERKLRAAEKIWPESTILKCLDVCLNIAMWNKYKKTEFLDKANDISGSFAEAKNKLEMTWQVKAQLMIEKLKDEKSGSEFDKNFCNENGIYYALLQKDALKKNLKECVVGKDSDSDFTTIQDALDSVVENGTVYVKPGVYREQLEFAKSVKLVGLQEPIMNKSSDELAIVALDQTKSCKIDIPVEIEGIVFTHNGNEKFASLKDYANQRLSFREDEDAYNESDYGDANFTTMLWVNSESKLANIAVLNSEVYGITFSKGEAELKDSVLFHCADNEISCCESASPKISGTLVSNCRYPGVYVGDNANPSISGCEIYGSLFSGLWVEGNASGSYENLDIHNNEGMGVNIDETASPEIKNCHIHENKMNGIYVENESAPKIIGCKIHDNKTDGEEYPSLVVADNANPNISNCEIYGSLSSGLWVTDNATGIYENIDIYNNEDMGVDIDETASPEIKNCHIHENKTNGIYVVNESAPKIIGCKIHDNKTEGQTYPGIVAGDDTAPEISDCEIYGHLSYGIWIQGNACGSVLNCKIHDNADVGVGIEGSSEPKIKGCEIYGSLFSGLWVKGNASGSYEDIDIHNNDSGVDIDETASPEIKNCHIHENTGNGLNINGDSIPKIIGCKIHDNKTDEEGCPSLVVADNANPNISNCEIYGSLDSGLDVTDNATGIYENIDIHNNSGIGVNIRDSAAPEIKNCHIHENSQNGIYIEDNSSPKIIGCEINDNKAEGCEFPGVAITDTANPTVSDCEIYDHLSDGIWITNSATGKYFNNEIYGNTGESICNRSSKNPQILGA